MMEKLLIFYNLNCLPHLSFALPYLLSEQEALSCYSHEFCAARRNLFLFVIVSIKTVPSEGGRVWFCFNTCVCVFTFKNQSQGNQLFM